MRRWLRFGSFTQAMIAKTEKLWSEYAGETVNALTIWLAESLGRRDLRLGL